MEENGGNGGEGGPINPVVCLRVRELCPSDPADATGPFVTTSIDVLGILLYFIIAGLLLGI